MTTAERPPPAPRFTAWSPIVAGAADLTASFLPGWITALVWVLGVVCALPFWKFRAVVPWALLTWSVAWLLSVILILTESAIVGSLLISQG